MSFVSVVPDAVSSAAGNLESIGSTLNLANNAAAAPTAGLVPVAADQVSAAVTAAFAQHAQDYQFIGAQVAAFHSQFVNTLNTGLGQYVDTEAANAQQAAANAVNGPVQALLGHPLASPGGAGAPDAPADPSITVLNSPFGPVSPAATSTNPDGSLTYRSARPTVPAPSASPTGYAGAPYNAAVAHGNGLTLRHRGTDRERVAGRRRMVRCAVQRPQCRPVRPPNADVSAGVGGTESGSCTGVDDQRSAQWVSRSA